MTAIVGLMHEGEVYVGCDSRATFGYTHMTINGRKIARCNDALIAVAGDPRVLQLIETTLTVPERAAECDPLRWLITDFAKALRDLLNEQGLMGQEEGKQSTKCSLIVGVAGRLFYADGYLAIYETSRGYEAGGSGGEVCLGSLYTTDTLTNMTPDRRLLCALAAAEENIPSVGRPFHIEKL